jgi:hypothetical protein
MRLFTNKYRSRIESKIASLESDMEAIELQKIESRNTTDQAKMIYQKADKQKIISVLKELLD